ncbi:MAG TPA: hypothetical protein VFC74_06950 [Oscillospiraceae bacterium]|nr:hypothetical protein [Oscillospiraceae bacterium]
MTEKLNVMFEESTSENTPVGTKSLEGTAQLTSIANTIAQELIKTISSDVETHGEMFEKSKEDHNAMDDLVKALYDLSVVETEFLKELGEDVLNGMLKSQQSKRSRSKGKTMTIENYRNMMSGAIAELLLRDVLGKPKAATGYRRASGSLEYSDEEIEMYRNDQDLLRRELRNVQSKKSIEKRKEDFSEESERWKQLIVAEDILKSMRVGGTSSRTVIVDKTGEQLKAELGDRDVNDLKAAEAKALLKKLLEAAGGEAAQEVEHRDE